MRSLRFSTIIGSLVNSSNRYCHSQVSWPNVPLVTKKIPLERKKERKKNLNISEDLRGNREYAMLSHSGVQGINILS